MGKGALIRYRLRVRGMPVSWLTEITAWEPPHRFVDEQVRGPYTLWHHTHTFEALDDGGTLMRDVVRYRVGFGPLGVIADRPASCAATSKRSSTSARSRSRRCWPDSRVGDHFFFFFFAPTA